MKIKTYINNIIAIVAVLTLVGGFQVTANTDYQSPEKADIIFALDTTFGIEDAYAGPCGRAGCDGKPTYCKPVTILNIGQIQMVKHCAGTPRD